MTQMRIAVITHHKFIRYPKRGSEKAHEVSAFQHCHDCGYHKKKRGIFGKPKVENPTHVLVFAQSKELMEEHKRKGTPEGKRHGMVSFFASNRRMGLLGSETLAKLWGMGRIRKRKEIQMKSRTKARCEWLVNHFRS